MSQSHVFGIVSSNEKEKGSDMDVEIKERTGEAEEEEKDNNDTAILVSPSIVIEYGGMRYLSRYASEQECNPTLIGQKENNQVLVNFFGFGNYGYLLLLLLVLLLLLLLLNYY